MAPFMFWAWIFWLSSSCSWLIRGFYLELKEKSEVLMSIFLGSKKLVGMIHVDALPGTPLYRRKLSEIVERAREDAGLNQKADIDML